MMGCCGRQNEASRNELTTLEYVSLLKCVEDVANTLHEWACIVIVGWWCIYGLCELVKALAMMERSRGMALGLSEWFLCEFVLRNNPGAMGGDEFWGLAGNSYCSMYLGSGCLRHPWSLVSFMADGSLRSRGPAGASMCKHITLTWASYFLLLATLYRRIGGFSNKYYELIFLCLNLSFVWDFRWECFFILVSGRV